MPAVIYTVTEEIELGMDASLVKVLRATEQLLARADRIRIQKESRAGIRLLWADQGFCWIARGGGSSFLRFTGGLAGMDANDVAHIGNQVCETRMVS